MPPKLLFGEDVTPGEERDARQLVVFALVRDASRSLARLGRLIDEEGAAQSLPPTVRRVLASLVRDVETGARQPRHPFGGVSPWPRGNRSPTVPVPANQTPLRRARLRRHWRRSSTTRSTYDPQAATPEPARLLRRGHGARRSAPALLPPSGAGQDATRRPPFRLATKTKRSTSGPTEAHGLPQALRTPARCPCGSSTGASRPANGPSFTTNSRLTSFPGSPARSRDCHRHRQHQLAREQVPVPHGRTGLPEVRDRDPAPHSSGARNARAAPRSPSGSAGRRRPGRVREQFAFTDPQHHA